MGAGMASRVAHDSCSCPKAVESMLLAVAAAGVQQLAELEALLPPGPSVHLAGERPRRHAFGAASPLHLSGVAISLRGGGQQESTLRVAEPGVGLGENTVSNGH